MSLNVMFIYMLAQLSVGDLQDYMYNLFIVYKRTEMKKEEVCFIS